MYRDGRQINQKRDCSHLRLSAKNVVFFEVKNVLLSLKYYYSELYKTNSIVFYENKLRLDALRICCLF